MFRKLIGCVVAAWLAGLGAAAQGTGDDLLRKNFVESPAPYHSRPLWFWNKPGTTADEVREIMTQSKEQSGYQGFGILPMLEPETYLAAPYFALYGAALETAARLDMKMCLYDEFWFPSGSAGGQLAKRFPEALAKRLDLLALDVTGPKTVTQAVPEGVFMGAVAMGPGGKDRQDISASVKEGRLEWAAPAGDWKVMLFTCVSENVRGGLVDYLDPAAVRRFVELTHEQYYTQFPEHFGTTIDSAFYDEPTFHWVQGGRAWTPAFNEKFKERYGFDPVAYYPALWFDIGPDTAAARNALFGFRAALYAEGFPKVLDDWCRAHKIQMTGHVDQEEIVNPVGLCGDLMKAFEHQTIPGVDQIGQYGRGSKMYKVVSSAADNYDRPLVMVECYGAMDLPLPNLYREAMDLFAKGVNDMVPHAVWTDPKNITFKPELSWRDPVYGPALPAYNRYIGRLQCMLQTGRHVADIGVLYPIATLQAGYHFGGAIKPYEGGVIPAEADYMDLGETLALQVRRDFTFVHPEVLTEKCRVDGAAVRLDNATNFETFKVFIMPGAKAIEWDALQKIQEFFNQGGKVIATTQLPDRSAEFGKDAEVCAAIKAMFGDTSALASGFTVQTNAKGGKAYFTKWPTAEVLQNMLDDAMVDYDVRFEEGVQAAGGNLTYIHKVVDGREVYFIGNSSDTAVDTQVRLRGEMTLESWDPHTGEIAAAESTAEAGVTRVHLKLGPVRSVFWVSKRG